MTYAGETVTTTDDVAEALVQLTASIAADGQAEAVSIPIVTEGGATDEAELVIGVGNDVLSAPAHTWTGDEPDFGEAAEELRKHKRFPQAPAIAHEQTADSDNPDAFWDPTSTVSPAPDTGSPRFGLHARGRRGGRAPGLAARGAGRDPRGRRGGRAPGFDACGGGRVSLFLAEYARPT